MTASTTVLVSHDPDGHLANNRSERPSVASDAMHVTFTSLATNLVTADTNRGVDVFAYNRHRSLTCVAGALSAVGCLSGYGFKASSDRMGLESFYAYHAFDMGSDTGYLNVSNGNLVVQGTDLEVPGRGLNMRLTHTYNSQKDQGDGPLGRGWRIGVADGESEDLLDAVVSAVLSADVGQILEVVVTEDQFDFHDADGTRHHFIKGGLDGPGWHSPPGVDLKLTDYLVGTERRYKATRPDGVAYEFRPLGGPGAYLLSTVRDRNGNTLTFSYSSGRLSSITDAAGRSMTFARSGDYLDSATYNLTTVDYTVTAGRLTSVSVGGRTTNYTYDAEGLRTVRDGRGNTTTLSISGGMLTQVTDRAGKAWRVAYNTAACQPGDPRAAVATCVTDPDPAEPTTGAAHTEVYTSSAEGNLLVRRDAGDPTPRQRSWVWEGNRVTSETDEGGTTTDYVYNDNGQIVLTRQSGGDGSEPVTTALLYRDVAPGVADLVEARVGAGSSDERVWRFGRSEEGNLTSTTAPDGTVTRFTYLSGGLLSSVTDPRGKVTTYGNYHASGQPQLVTDPAGKSRTMAYDAFGRPTSLVDRTGQTFTIGYDARGNVTSRATPSGTATFTYDLNDNQTSATPPGGATVTRVYDARDLPTEVRSTVDGIVRKSTYAYFDDGQLKQVNGPRTFAGTPTVAQKVEFRRFPNNRVSAAVDENGAVTDFTYTPEGLVRTVLEPPGTLGRRLTTYTYNRRGQVTSISDTGHSNPVTNTYGVHGELLSTKTPAGRTATFAYDKLGRLLRTVDPAGRQSTRTYDAAGNLVALTQPEGNGGSLTTTYTYTARNEIASETDPADGSHTVEYTYDDEGRQRFRYDKYNGVVRRTVEQTYRGDGSLLTRTATGAVGSGYTGHTSTYGYDAAGNLTSAAATVGGAPVSSLSLTRNGAFEVTAWSETVHDTAGVGRTKSGTYAYQPDGLLSSRTVDGLTTNYTHRADGGEATVTPWAGGGFTNEYFDNGLLRKTTMPNGAVVDQLFDPADRLVSRIVRKNDTAMTQLSAWTGIAYDEDDQRTHETVTQAQVPGTTTEPVKAGDAEYTYDPIGRLTSAKHPFEPDTVQYTLDDGGNVLRDADSAYTYAKNRLTRRHTTTTEDVPEFDATVTAVENATYAYDNLGNLAGEVATRTVSVAVEGEAFTFSQNRARGFSYDAASHPVGVTDDDGSSVGYVYDALDRLVRRVERPASGPDVVTLFFHDGVSGELALETDGAGTPQTRYMLDSAGAPLGQEKGGSRSYYVEDPRGNVTQQLDGSQTPVAVYGYDPYGRGKEALTHRAGSANWDSRLRFQAAPWDPAAGAYNLGPRLFDPGINRFVGADTYMDAAADMGLALDPLTGNRYLYAGADPAGMVDDGHGPCAFGHRKKHGKKHPGCKGGSRHVKKVVKAVKKVAGTAVRTTVQVAREVVETTVQMGHAAAVAVGRGAREVYRLTAEHAEVIAQAAGVAAFAACIVTTGGLCSAAAGVALGATLFESGVDNRIFTSGNNWNAFVVEAGVAFAGWETGRRLGNFTRAMEKGIRLRGYQPVVSRGYGIGTRLWGSWLLLGGQQELVGQ